MSLRLVLSRRNWPYRSGWSLRRRWCLWRCRCCRCSGRCRSCRRCRSLLTTLTRSRRWTIGLGATLMSLRSKDREHLVALHAGAHLNFADVRQILFELFQNARTQFTVRHLAAAKPDRRLHFVAFREPLTRMFHAIAVIVLVGTGTKLNFFDSDDDLFLLGFVRLLLGQVLKLAIVDDFAHRRIGV